MSGTAAAAHAVTGTVRLVDRTLVDRVRTRLVSEQQRPTPHAVARALAAEGSVLGDAGVRSLVDALHAELVGLGPLQSLAADPAVTDILVVGCDAVWVDSGNGLVATSVRFASDDDVTRLARRLATTCARRLDDAQPFVDGRLADGVRLHAVLPPISERPCISLRLARRRAFTLDELQVSGSMDTRMRQVLESCVEQRRAFLVSGGTGSGKTTLLSALLGLVPDEQRMVLVEDTAELAPSHAHVVRLQARPANVEGSGEVTVRMLVRQALRMRPDRLVVGEVRGAEVVDLLAALNTGHEGGCGTVHANAPQDVPARLEALGTAGGLDRVAVHSQMAAALDVVIHVQREPGGSRVVAAVGVLQRAADGAVHIVPALRYGSSGSEPAPAWLELASRLSL